MVQLKVDYKDSHQKLVRNHELIFDRYLKKGSFYQDVTALLPLHMLKLQRSRWSYLLVIKVIRLFKGLKNFDINVLLTWYKKNQQKKLDILIKNNQVLANNKEIDQTNIGKILIMSFVLKVLKMTLVIFSCSYFFAMIFKIFLDLQRDIMDWD